jgi:hypothetical protein
MNELIKDLIYNYEAKCRALKQEYTDDPSAMRNARLKAKFYTYKAVIKDLENVISVLNTTEK